MAETDSQNLAGTQRFAFDESDTPEIRRQKQAIFVVASGCTLAGIVWTAMYWFVFGWCLTTVLPCAFTVIVGSALALSHRTRNHHYAAYAQILCITYITAFIQWSLGDIYASGFVLVWAFVGPITALAVFSPRKSAVFLGLYFVNLAITLACDDVFGRHGLPVSEQTRHMFFAMNLSVSTLIVFFFATFFAQSADTQRARADRLQVSLDEEKAKQVGPYTLLSKIGAGGMGVVYKARHALLRRPTAVKLLPVDKIGEESLLRFEREVQHTAELTHPNTVAIHDYGRSADGVFYYAMEFLDGIDLETLVRRSGPLPPERAVFILRQACDALEEAHLRGLVHRDVKPANIMVCRQGRRADVVKVLDFGLVKDLSIDDGVTREDAIAGTPAYIAPETVTNPAAVGPGVDIYAMGAVAYWLLTGQTLFKGKTHVEVFAHHVHTPPTPPSKQVEGIPDALERLILSCLAKQPRERPASAGAMVEALDAIAPSAPWASGRAHAWWDAFDAERSADAEPPPVSATAKTMAVDLHSRVRKAGPVELVSGVETKREVPLKPQVDAGAG